MDSPRDKQTTSPKRLSKYNLEVLALIAEFDAATTSGDTRERERTVRRLDKIIGRAVRRRVSRDNPNSGLDICKKASELLMDGLLMPSSPTGITMRENFSTAVDSRSIDAWRSSMNFQGPLHVDADPELQIAPDTPETAMYAIDLFERMLLPNEAIELASWLAGYPAVTRKRQRSRKAIARGLSRNFETGLFTGEDEFDGVAKATNPAVVQLMSRLEMALVAFEIACPNPTDAQVAKWSADFPQFAGDFQFCAQVLRGDDVTLTDPEELLLREHITAYRKRREEILDVKHVIIKV